MFAILYRTNAQSRSFEESLRRMNIPYRIYGGTSFYQRKEVKDFLAYLRVIVNSQDEENIKRIINYPARGIGKTSIEKIMVVANGQEKDLLGGNREPPAAWHERCGGGAALENFVTMIQSFRTHAGESKMPMMWPLPWANIRAWWQSCIMIRA